MIGRFAPKADAEEPAKPKGFDDFDLRLGDTMRGERATLGKSLLDVQRELKIKATYIAAIENCDPTAFETPGFIAGYVRSYARYLGMDPDQSFEDFCRESNFKTADGMSVEASSHKKERAQSGQGNYTAPSSLRDPFANPNVSFVPRGEALMGQIEPGAIGSVAVLAGLIGLLAFGGWSVLQEIQKVELATADEEAVIVAGIDPLGSAQSIVAERPDPVRTEALERLYRPQALELPVMEPRDGPIASVDPNRFGVFATPREEIREQNALSQIVTLDSPVIEPEVQVVEVSDPGVTLVAVRPAWIRVQGSEGTVLFEKVLDAGEEYFVPQTETPPVVRVGESGAVYFKLHGDLYGPVGEQGTVTSNVVLAADTLAETYQIADMTQDRDLARVVAEAATAVIEELSE